jgi:methyl-accepting chemotaxis protein
MTVITNSTLLVRRINEMQRRREALVSRQEQLRRTLPEWTFMPLQLVGMSREEIQGLMSDLSDAEQQAGLDEIDRQLEQLDSQVEELENMLLTTPASSLENVQAVLDLAVHRFRAQTVSDPNDVFYDYGDARVLFFLERAAEDLRSMLAAEQRNAG